MISCLTFCLNLFELDEMLLTSQISAHPPALLSRCKATLDLCRLATEGTSPARYLQDPTSSPKMIARITTRSQDEKVSEEGNELTRLCDMIQRIFFKIRESTFERNISKVETEDDKRYFYDEPRESHVVVSALPEGLSDEDRAAVLSYMRCAFSVSLMWNIQNVLLKGTSIACLGQHGEDLTQRRYR